MNQRLNNNEEKPISEIAASTPHLPPSTNTRQVMLRIVVTFIAIGPPLGAIILFVLNFVRELSELLLAGFSEYGLSLLEWVQYAFAYFLFFLVWVFLVSYILGGVQAIVVGVAAAISMRWPRHLRFLLVIVSCLPVPVYMILYSITEEFNVLVVLAIHIIPAIFCLCFSDRFSIRAVQ